MKAGKHPLDVSKGWCLLKACVLLLMVFGAVSCNGSPSHVKNSREGTPKAMRGGSPIVRVPYEPTPDDPETTNDEENDQPLGYLGSATG